MPGTECGKHGHRKHTPITSKKQRGFFGAELRRRRKGQKGRMKGITTEELRSHLMESKGRRLPARAGRKVKRLSAAARKRLARRGKK
jgi:hypothetical protein